MNAGRHWCVTEEKPARQHGELPMMLSSMRTWAASATPMTVSKVLPFSTLSRTESGHLPLGRPGRERSGTKPWESGYLAGASPQYSSRNSKPRKRCIHTAFSGTCRLLPPRGPPRRSSSSNPHCWGSAGRSNAAGKVAAEAARACRRQVAPGSDAGSVGLGSLGADSPPARPPAQCGHFRCSGTLPCGTPYRGASRKTR